VAELGTSKSGGTISQLGCSTSVACHGSPRKQQQQQQQQQQQRLVYHSLFTLKFSSTE
jgi:hypothetical protein